MKLTIKDRVLLLNEIMPQFDNMQGIIIKNAIMEKLKLSESENDNIVTSRLPTGVMEIGFKTTESQSSSKSFEFTDEELFYIKNRIHMVDVNGMISSDNIDTYQKILTLDFKTKEYKERWKEIVPSDNAENDTASTIE